MKKLEKKDNLASSFKLVVCSLQLAAVCLLISGCASVPKKDPSVGGPAGLSAQTIARFSDIPVPAGFKLLGEESYAFEGAGVRVAVLKYRGKSDADSVVLFYKEQMPMHDWALLNIIEYGNRLLNFDREKEICVVSLIPKGSTVEIIVSLGPKSITSAKRPLK